MPSAYVFRLDDVPLARSAHALVQIPGALRDAAHFVYPSSEAELARALRDIPEPAIGEELTADLLAVDAALSEVFRAEGLLGAPTEALRYGFHAGASVDVALAALSGGGLEVRSYAEAAGAPEPERDDEVCARASERLFAAARGRADEAAAAGLDEVEAYVCGASPALDELDARARDALADHGLGLLRFAEALGGSAERWGAASHRLLDVFVRVFGAGELPRFEGGSAGEAGHDRAARLARALAARGVPEARVLAENAWLGVGPARWASRGWLAAEQLARLDALVDAVQAERPDRTARAFERVVLDVPVALWRTTGARRAVAGLLSRSDAPELATAPALRRLVEHGAVDAREVARLLGARPPMAASATHAGSAGPRELGPALDAMRGGEVDPRFDGPGTERATYFVRAPRVTEKHLLHATDARWSHSGEKVLVVADAVRVLRRASRGNLRAENAAGAIAFEPLRDYPPVPPRAKPSANVVLSADFDAHGLLLTAWRHGELRRGPADTDPSTHALVASFDAPVLRVRAAPSSDAIALVVGRDLVLVTGDGPRAIGEASTGDDPGLTADPASAYAAEGAKAYVAWTPDGRALGVCRDGELAIFDAGGERVRAVRIAGDFESHGGLDATDGAFVVPRVDGLAVVPRDGSLRTLPRPSPAGAGAIAGRAAAAPGGRVVVVPMTWDHHADAPATLEVFDLETGRAFVLGVFAKHLPHCPLAFAPTGDALAFASDWTLRVHAWGLGVERDEGAERIGLARAVAKSGHATEALAILAGVHAPAHRDKLAKDAASLHSEIEASLPSKPASSVFDAPRPLAPPRHVPSAVPGQLQEGQTVEHHRLGRGIVVHVEGQGHGARITVEFDAGERTLPASTLTAVDDAS